MSRRFSYSRLNCYNECPRQYKFKYVEKIKLPRQLIPDATLGDTVHKVLAELYKHGADGIVIPLEDCLAKYQNFWEEKDPTAFVVRSEYYTIDDYIRLGREMLTRHYEKYHPFCEGDLLGTETSLSCEIPGTNFSLLGYVDRFWRRDDGLVEIRDYKTGQSIPKPHDRRFFFQMGIYQFLVRANYDCAAGVMLSQHFLRRDEIVSYQMRDDEMDVLAEDLRTSILEIQNAERLDSFPTCEGWACNYCDFSELCPAKRHTLELEGELESNDASQIPDPETLRMKATRYIELDGLSKSYKAEMDILKKEFIQLASNGQYDQLDGAGGTVKIKFTRACKFITKTADSSKFAALSQLARELELDEFFTLAGPALMKEIYNKKRLSDEQLEKLSEFVEEVESGRVSVKHRLEKKDDE